MKSITAENIKSIIRSSVVYADSGKTAEITYKLLGSSVFKLELMLNRNTDDMKLKFYFYRYMHEEYNLRPMRDLLRDLDLPQDLDLLQDLNLPDYLELSDHHFRKKLYGNIYLSKNEYIVLKGKFLHSGNLSNTNIDMDGFENRLNDDVLKAAILDTALARKDIFKSLESLAKVCQKHEIELNWQQGPIYKTMVHPNKAYIRTSSDWMLEIEGICRAIMEDAGFIDNTNELQKLIMEAILEFKERPFLLKHIKDFNPLIQPYRDGGYTTIQFNWTRITFDHDTKKYKVQLEISDLPMPKIGFNCDHIMSEEFGLLESRPHSLLSDSLMVFMGNTVSKSPSFFLSKYLDPISQACNDNADVCEWRWTKIEFSDDELPHPYSQNYQDHRTQPLYEGYITISAGSLDEIKGMFLNIMEKSGLTAHVNELRTFIIENILELFNPDELERRAIFRNLVKTNNFPDTKTYNIITRMISQRDENLLPLCEGLRNRLHLLQNELTLSIPKQVIFSDNLMSNDKSAAESVEILRVMPCDKPITAEDVAGKKNQPK